MAKIADLGDINVTFVPRTRSRYFEYAPLLHLLPRRVLDTFGLPAVRGVHWPFLADPTGIDDFLPPDFDTRLAHAWASTVREVVALAIPGTGVRVGAPARPGLGQPALLGVGRPHDEADDGPVRRAAQHHLAAEEPGLVGPTAPDPGLVPESAMVDAAT